jgi:hypothetical protein
MSKLNLDDKIAQMRQDILLKITKGQFKDTKPVSNKEYPVLKARNILRISGDQYGSFIRCKRSDCSVDISTCSECGVFRGENDKDIYCDYDDSGMKILKDEDDVL